MLLNTNQPTQGEKGRLPAARQQIYEFLLVFCKDGMVRFRF